MKDTVAQNVTNASIAVSTTSAGTVAVGNLETINHFAPVIGLLLSFISIVVGIVFFILNYRKEQKKKETYLIELRKSIKKELLEELKEAQSNAIQMSKVKNQNKEVA